MAAPILARQGSYYSLETSFADHEQDANTALTDLDKGLRSMKMGLQCESIVRFPALFERYPFPILINSASLKLADVFRGGNNFIRLCVLRVMQQSEKQLDKILNIDEFMRRIFTVLHSNDPVARAITLRTLGSIATIIAERKNIHHSIVVCLDSHDAVEVEASIFAAEKFSAKSKTFAINICNKIAEMIERLETPIDLKIKLIPILQYMHHSAAISSKALQVCQTLLSVYPAQKFVSLTLHTMTKLTLLSLTDIDSHISLLISYLEDDPRCTVKVIALQNLKLLAKNQAHTWSVEQVEQICNFSLKTPLNGLKIGVMEVLVVLAQSVVLQLFPPDKLDHLLDIGREFCFNDNVTLASRSIQLLTELAVYFNKKGSNHVLNETITAIQTLIIINSSNTEKQEQKALKECLKCASNLCSVVPDICSSFVAILSGILFNASGHTAELICECLAVIGMVNSESLEPVVTQLIDVIQSCKKCTQLQVFQSTLLFQAARGRPLNEDVFTGLVSNHSLWFAYRIGRQAMRFGQFSLAGTIFSSLRDKVASEHYYFWLNALSDVCHAESQLQKTTENQSHFMNIVADFGTHQQKGLSSLRNGMYPLRVCCRSALQMDVQQARRLLLEIMCPHSGGVRFKAATTPGYPLKFQCEFINLRQDIIQAHCQLIRSCNTFRSCPPPAIATALAMTNGQEISRCGQIVHQLAKCISTYKDLSERLGMLYKSSFDADPATLSYLQLLQQSCETIKVAIESILQTDGTSIPLQSDLHTSSSSFNEILLLNTLADVNQQLKELLQTNSNIILTYTHIEFLSDTAKKLVHVPFGFPRYFFQTLQTTFIKLAISPQQGSTLEHVSLSCDSFLTLKVEGVIIHGKKPCLFRKVHQAKITVSSNLQSRSAAASDGKMNLSTTNLMENIAEPHNDYFSSNFLLPFPVPGIHSILIEAAIVDSDGTLWHTGPQVSMTVKSYDESFQRQNQRYAPKLPSTSQNF